MVVVVGGVGNLFGTIISALAIGIINYIIIVGSSSAAVALSISNSGDLGFINLVDFFNFFSTTSMAKVLVFALIIAFLQIKPAGIFPQKGRGVEL